MGLLKDQESRVQPALTYIHFDANGKRTERNMTPHSTTTNTPQSESQPPFTYFVSNEEGLTKVSRGTTSLLTAKEATELFNRGRDR